MADAIVQVFEGRATISFSGPEVISSLLTQASAAAQSAAEDAGRAVEAKDEIVAISDLIQESIIPPDLDVGTVQSGSSNLIRMDRIVTKGANDGTSQVYQLVNRIYARGAVNYDSVRAHYSGTHIDTTAGTTTNADGLHQYVWLSGAGNVTYSKVIAAHLRADGPGDVGEAILFRAVSTTLGADASVGQIKGFSSGQLGDPTKVDSVIAFDAEDTSAVSYAIGFRSTFMAGDNKYAFFGAGTAPSAFGGKVGIGQTIPPLYQLTVKTADGNWTGDLTNTSPSNPYGIRVSYSDAAAPATSENYFFAGYINGTQKFGVSSNGRVIVNGNAVLNSRQAAVTAPTGGSTIDAQARTAINDLIQRLQAHGLIS